MLVEEMDHRQVIANMPPERRSLLLEKSDRRGLLHLLAHAGIIVALAFPVALGIFGWPLLMVPLGIAIMFLFTALHEATHGTAYSSAWINRSVAVTAGFLTFTPPHWFYYFHMAHHRHTQDAENDPELEGGKPEALRAYLLYLSGITIWKSNLAVLLRCVAGRADFTYVPKKSRGRLITEARLLLLAYGILLAGSVALRSSQLLWLWIIPALLGQPFLRAYLLAEHTRCPLVANMLENSRTTFTWPVVRFIAWNMPYHAEHHAYPNVPFWKLPAFHELMRAHLRATERGYSRFHRKFAASLSSKPRDQRVSG